MKTHNHFATLLLSTFLVNARLVSIRLVNVRLMSVRLVSALLVSVAMSAAMSTSALAHKVILDAYVLGTQIEGELGFSNGDVGAFSQVHVLDQNDNLMATLDTDADGFFTYIPHYLVDHYLYVDLGAGHVANTLVVMDDLAFLADAASLKDYQPDNLVAFVKTPVTDIQSSNRQTMQTPQELDGLSKDIRRMSGEVRELRKALNRYKEKNTLQQILGGLGYILGLVGLWFYMRARQLLRQQASVDEKQP